MPDSKKCADFSEIFKAFGDVGKFNNFDLDKAIEAARNNAQVVSDVAKSAYDESQSTLNCAAKIWQNSAEEMAKLLQNGQTFAKSPETAWQKQAEILQKTFNDSQKLFEAATKSGQATAKAVGAGFEEITSSFVGAAANTNKSKKSAA